MQPTSDDKVANKGKPMYQLQSFYPFFSNQHIFSYDFGLTVNSVSRLSGAHQGF
jgi:hypothetical protein